MENFHSGIIILFSIKCKVTTECISINSLQSCITRKKERRNGDGKNFWIFAISGKKRDILIYSEERKKPFFAFQLRSIYWRKRRWGKKTRHNFSLFWGHRKLLGGKRQSGGTDWVRKDWLDFFPLLRREKTFFSSRETFSGVSLCGFSLSFAQLMGDREGIFSASALFIVIVIIITIMGFFPSVSALRLTNGSGGNIRLSVNFVAIGLPVVGKNLPFVYSFIFSAEKKDPSMEEKWVKGVSSAQDKRDNERLTDCQYHGNMADDDHHHAADRFTWNMDENRKRENGKHKKANFWPWHRPKRHVFSLSFTFLHFYMH